jgi:two-component system response regulator MprA
MDRYILVVDDDPDIRDLLEQTLTMEGFAVRTAAHGRDALTCMAQAPPAAILLDLNMPVMDGWQLLQELRARDVAVPVVFMSAGQPVRDEAAHYQVDGYLAKPFELDDVVRVVRHATSADTAGRD